MIIYFSGELVLVEDQKIIIIHYICECMANDVKSVYRCKWKVLSINVINGVNIMNNAWCLKKLS